MRLRTDRIFTTPIMYVKLTDEPIFQDIVDVLDRINDPNLEDYNMTKSHEIASKAGSRQYKIKIHGDELTKHSSMGIVKDAAGIWQYTDPIWEAKRNNVLDQLNNIPAAFIRECFESREPPVTLYKAHKIILQDMMWTVSYREGDYQAFHTHPGSALAGVLFIEVPPGINEESDPDGYLTLVNDGIFDITTFRAEKLFSIKPEVGLLVVFPASIGHMVYPFRGPGTRRILALNWGSDIKYGVPYIKDFVG